MGFIVNIGLGILLALYALLLAKLLRLQDSVSSGLLKTLSRLYNINQLPRFATRLVLEMLWVLILYKIFINSIDNLYILYLVIILIRLVIIAGADTILKLSHRNTVE